MADGHITVTVNARADEVQALIAEIGRLVHRVERLRGLCKTSVGMLRDAGRDADADCVHALIGDMEARALQWLTG